MKKSYLLGALGLLAMASCSQDETIGINHDGDEITFNVVTNNATRASGVFCNQNLPDGFYVSAISDGKTYIDKDYVTNSDGNWTNTSGTRYWPETAVDFYAHVNGGDAYKWNNGSPKFEGFTVNGTVAEQVDLLYAVKKNQSKANGKVILNFRHALSQIVFQAKNTNANLYVEIAGVSVANVGGKNTFTFPSVNTETNIDHPETGPGDDGVYEDDEFGSIPYGASWGAWDNLTSGTEKYDVDFDKTPVEGNNTLVALTTANETGEEYNSNAMLLLPQKTTAWDPEANPVPDAAGNTGSYLLVDCAIFNVAGTDYAEGNDVCLWGEQKEGAWTTKELAIPVAFDWQQGKKYVYTLVFGEGNGGYNPDPEDPDPEDPDPVLVPITFEITVDEFVPVDGGEIESGIPGEGA